jgi:hypothetical protein
MCESSQAQAQAVMCRTTTERRHAINAYPGILHASARLHVVVSLTASLFRHAPFGVVLGVISVPRNSRV